MTETCSKAVGTFPERAAVSASPSQIILRERAFQSAGEQGEELQTEATRIIEAELRPGHPSYRVMLGDLPR